MRRRWKEFWISAVLGDSGRLLESADVGGFHCGLKEAEELDRDTSQDRDKQEP